MRNFSKPLPASHPFTRLENVVLTAHLGWPTDLTYKTFAEDANYQIRKYLAGDYSSLENPEWTNTTVITGDLSARVGELKQQMTGDILVSGSGQLVSALAGAGLVDEYRLMVFPTALGRGKRLFEGVGASLPFRLTETRQAGDTLILIYAPR